MNDETKAFLKAKLEEGKSADEARRELISYGYDSAGFNEAYGELTQELGIEKPALTTSNDTAIGMSTEENTEVILPGLFVLLQDAFKLTFSNISSVLGATLLVGVISLVTAFMPTEPNFYLSGVTFFLAWLILSVLTVLVSIVASMALFYAIVQSKEEMNFLHGIQWVMQNIFSIIVLWIAITMIFFASSVALIVPGFAFLVYSVLSFVVLAKGNHKGIRAIIRSTDLVSGQFWGVLYRVLVPTFVFLLILLPLVLVIGMSAMATDISPIVSFLITVVAIFFQMCFTALMASVLSEIYDACARGKRLFDMSLYGGLKWIYRIMIVFSLIALGGVILLGGTISVESITKNFDARENSQQNISDADNRNEGLDDFLIRARLDESYTSAQYYLNRLGFYDGVCSDVVRREPVDCQNNNNGFLLYAPLTNGQYYCRDSAGFKGVVVELPESVTCQ